EGIPDCRATAADLARPSAGRHRRGGPPAVCWQRRAGGVRVHDRRRQPVRGGLAARGRAERRRRAAAVRLCARLRDRQHSRRVARAARARMARRAGPVVPRARASSARGRGERTVSVRKPVRDYRQRGARRRCGDVSEQEGVMIEPNQLLFYVIITFFVLIGLSSLLVLLGVIKTPDKNFRKWAVGGFAAVVTTAVVGAFKITVMPEPIVVALQTAEGTAFPRLTSGEYFRYDQNGKGTHNAVVPAL